MSNSVDFNQTAHIQELSDLCLQPFVRPINPFGIFFDLRCKVQATGVNLAFFPPKKSRGQYDIKVGNRPVNMSIDQTSGHYWL